MSLLVDWEIRKLTLQERMLDPFAEADQSEGRVSSGLTHAGYDLRLGNSVLVYKNTMNEIISPKRMKSDKEYQDRIFDRFDNLIEGAAVIIPPHGYILAYSLEYIRMPNWLKGRCVGKSSNARCGVLVNTTPLEPGWKGHLTIEVANITPCPVEVYVGEGIAQLEFDTLHATPEKDYSAKKGGGKYQDQGPEPVTAKVKE